MNNRRRQRIKTQLKVNIILFMRMSDEEQIERLEKFIKMLKER